MEKKIHFIIGILTLISINAFGGTYYVEVPEHLTDEMMLSQTLNILVDFT